MPRVKGGSVTRQRRKKILKLAKGYFGSKHTLYRTANEQVMRSLNYAFSGRKQRKRDFRKLWISRINAACKLNNIKYSLFISGLTKAGIEVNRKMLADIAVNDAVGFSTYVEQAKKGLNINTKKEVLRHAYIKVDAAEPVRKVETKAIPIKKTPVTIKSAPVAEKKVPVKEEVKDYVVKVKNADTGKMESKAVTKEEFELTSMNVVALRKIAIGLGVKGSASALKAALVEGILEARSKGIVEDHLNLLTVDELKEKALSHGVEEVEAMSKKDLVQEINKKAPSKTVTTSKETPQVSFDKESLGKQTISMLKDLANKLAITGYSKLKKAELIDALLNANKNGKKVDDLNQLLVVDLVKLVKKIDKTIDTDGLSKAKLIKIINDSKK